MTNALARLRVPDQMRGRREQEESRDVCVRRTALYVCLDSSVVVLTYASVPVLAQARQEIRNHSISVVAELRLPLSAAVVTVVNDADDDVACTTAWEGGERTRADNAAFHCRMGGREATGIFTWTPSGVTCQSNAAGVVLCERVDCPPPSAASNRFGLVSVRDKISIKRPTQEAQEGSAADADESFAAEAGLEGIVYPVKSLKRWQWQHPCLFLVRSDGDAEMRWKRNQQERQEPFTDSRAYVA
jgi:hypothetical protein